MQKHERFLLPATLMNEGGFSNETLYRIILANGQTMDHLGFTDYTFDSLKNRNKNHNWKGPKDGFIEVIFHDLVPNNRESAVVEPPQVHGINHSGLVVIPIRHLLPIPKHERNNRDKYGD